MKLVSVVVATYKRDDDLKKALESLIAQSYSNIEIILVDDNGNEEWNSKVSAIVDVLRQKFPQMSLNYIINNPNQGSAKTRNIGIKVAKGEYITFLDDDDVYLPEKIEMQLNDMVIENADYGLTDLYLYNKKDEIIDKRIRSYIKSTATKELMRYHLLHHMTGTDTLMFKTEYLKKIGGFPEIDVGDEFYLMKEAILGEGKCVYSTHCYVKAYVHTGETAGLSSGQGKIDGENNLYEEKKKYFNYLCKKDIRYLEMRHYAVIAFAELRAKRFGAFMLDAARAFFSSPVACVCMLLEHR